MFKAFSYSSWMTKLFLNRIKITFRLILGRADADRYTVFENKIKMYHYLKSGTYSSICKITRYTVSCKKVHFIRILFSLVLKQQFWVCRRHFTFHTWSGHEKLMSVARYAKYFFYCLSREYLVKYRYLQSIFGREGKRTAVLTKLQ